MKEESILRSLKKYQAPTEPEKIVVPEKESQQGVNLRKLAEQIVPSYQGLRREGEVDRVAKLLADMPASESIDVLYPLVTFARYHLFYGHRYPVNEGATDTEITIFMRNVELGEYGRRFESACDSASRRGILVRCLLATFPGFEKSKDRIPPEHRLAICNKLGIQIDTLQAAVRYQEQLNQEGAFNLEQQILGRLGYILIWNWINSGRKDSIPLISVKGQ
jgi:hypothetical protein